MEDGRSHQVTRDASPPSEGGKEKRRKNYSPGLIVYVTRVLSI